MVFAHYFENYLFQGYHITHADWSWWGLMAMDFGIIRLKVNVTGDTCEKCEHGFRLLSWELLYHRAFIFYILIGLYGDMTPIDFKLFR